MGRKTSLILTLALVATLLVAPLAAEAQQAGKVYRIGLLAAGVPLPHVVRAIAGFRLELQGRGYVEGQNLFIEERWAEGRLERLPELAGELLRANVDLIVAGGTPNALAARKVSATIPIVAVGATTVVESGLVLSLSKPGGNVTGVTAHAADEEWAKRLELLLEVAPRARNIAVVLNPAYPGVAVTWEQLQTAARKLGVTLQPVEVRSPADFDAAFVALAQRPTQALLVVLDQVVASQGGRIIDFASTTRLPTMWAGVLGRGFVEAGGLMAYAASLDGLWRQAAVYVDKILKGARPADLPMEQPTKFELVINLKTAKSLGLTIPQPVLLRADQVIQ